MFYIDFHTHPVPPSNKVLAIINQPLDVSKTIPRRHYLSYGVHPWEIKDADDQIAQVEILIQHPNVLCIGECGLDKSKGPDLKTQEFVFKKHIELSEKHEKPLLIHCVKAYSEIIKLRKDLHPAQTWIFHGFNSSGSTMKQALDAGFCFSYGPALLNPNIKVQNAFLNTPPDRLFLETDDSHTDIASIYTQAASILSIDQEELCKQTTTNFNRLFNLTVKAGNR